MSKINITHPIQTTRPSSSGEYAFILTDANHIEHYFNWDGTYDGYSNPPCYDGKSGMCLN